MQRVLWWLAPAWAAAASTYLLFAPTGASISTSVTLSQDGAVARSEAVPGSSSLLAHEGPSVLLPLLVPVLLTMLPLFTRRPKVRRVLGVIAALLLAPFCVLGMMSIGLLYVPSIPALLGAAILQPADVLPSDAAA